MNTMDNDLYLTLLQKANYIESKDPRMCVHLLQDCINELNKNHELQEKNPHHLTQLQLRILFYEDKSQYYKQITKNIQLIPAKNSETKKVEPVPVTKKKSGKVKSPENSAPSPVSSQEVSSVSTSSSVVASPNNTIQSSSPNEVVTSISSITPDISPEIAAIPTEVLTKTLELTKPIEQVYEKLRKNEPVSYDEYLLFYKSVNELISAPLPKIVREDADLIYYVGDTHGSFREAQIMIEYFDKVIEKFPTIKIVFLGDYVDRNPLDLENLTVLTAFYLLNLNNVVLLRGNHEDEEINRAYGFLANLEGNFNDPMRVRKIYSEILKYFTRLSIAHVNKMKKPHEDKALQIFAVHGGIPIDFDQPETPVQLSAIEPLLRQDATTYKYFDPYMNWLLWADPREEVNGIINDPQTGRSQFGKEPFMKFMNANNLDFMVRAHEKLTEGSQFFFDFHLISIFSTSYYSNRKIGSGKILRLQPGKTPALLPILADALNNDFAAL